MKKPMELAGILAMCGLMQILGSPPSSLLTSIASSSSFSLMKHSLHSKALYSTEAYLPHSSHEIWTKNWAKIVQKSVIFECACKLQESQGTKSPDDDLVSKNKREKKRKKRTLVCSFQLSPVTTLGFICSSIFVMISLSAVIKYTSLRPPNKK